MQSIDRAGLESNSERSEVRLFKRSSGVETGGAAVGRPDFGSLTGLVRADWRQNMNVGHTPAVTREDAVFRVARLLIFAALIMRSPDARDALQPNSGVAHERERQWSQ